MHQLTKKKAPRNWNKKAKDAFDCLKTILSNDTVLAHYDPSQQIGISCDASASGIGAVLFHRHQDGGERPISNASKTLTDAQGHYSQIRKEALAIIFVLKKFHQYIYGRNFILVTNHKPLLALFGPTTPTPALAANRLARWALTLSQYDYTIEYRKTSEHGNADVPSRLPIGPDAKFDNGEEVKDTNTVCLIRSIGAQLIMKNETAKDPILSKLKRYILESFSPKPDNDDPE